jgi:hypothetical protein
MDSRNGVAGRDYTFEVIKNNNQQNETIPNPRISA